MSRSSKSMSEFKVGPAAAVSDLERAREFYEGRLGLEIDQELPGGSGYAYACGDGTGLVVYLSPEHAGKSTATLCGWDVGGELEPVVDELTAKGVSFEQYDGEAGLRTDAKGIADVDGNKAAWFRDPDGNTHAINGS